ncbi:hypothetical protein [Microbacterium arborescens]|uniref:hypothetical protein n=1 Tax=Microbacterium arborescens TaxID=33883 RepID=UPI0027D7C2D5|nr:hypothetical protein [Microbacterium arborescens]
MIFSDQGLSATYRADLAALKPIVAADDHRRLIQLAQIVEVTRAEPDSSLSDLDQAVDQYMNFRVESVRRAQSAR